MVETISWKNGTLIFLDQTKLPVEVVYKKQKNIEQVWDAIKQLRVRGAPALGVAGAYGILLGMQHSQSLPSGEFITEMKKKAAYLNSSRPTAVNLSWGINRMMAKAESLKSKKSDEIWAELEKEAVAIHNEDKDLCRRIGETGKALIKDGMGILTHCNAGALCSTGIGTATAPMYTAFSEGRKFKVYADETRPLLQGARLTSWELQQAGVDVTLICDDMAAFMMSKGFINLVITGTDRVASNGDAANKIGTMGVAVLANYFHIPFYIACPFSTFDMNTAAGQQIPIEERNADEVLFFGGRRTGPIGVQVRNPAFDVTPHELITGYITENGIVKPPFFENLHRNFLK
ncbi:MAG: S-methyl-5-thioribose-1-phosphate isomerase [Treponema sp.]|nr:S-methyl-5-thioribose-1-phosphate isomerase [Treponema sp.]